MYKLYNSAHIDVTPGLYALARADVPHAGRVNGAAPFGLADRSMGFDGRLQASWHAGSDAY